MYKASALEGVELVFFESCRSKVRIDVDGLDSYDHVQTSACLEDHPI